MGFGLGWLSFGFSASIVGFWRSLWSVRISHSGQEEIKPAEAAGATPNKEALDLRKRANVPEIDPDALPSSYCQKLLLCLTKRTNKLQDIRDDCKPTNDQGQSVLTTSQNKILARPMICTKLPFPLKPNPEPNPHNPSSKPTPW